MKVIETSTGNNRIEELENEKELIIQHTSIEPRTGDYLTLEYLFQRGEEFAKLTHLKYDFQEKTVLWAQYLQAKEYDELLAQAKQIAATTNAIDREAKISLFVSYIFEKYYKPDP
jgi:guanylate kinase